ncbi:MAG: RluA family pseudouridine synthase [Candidatus Syntrophonatronum acetioxidans]|uniref:Pseudouridine synthase n=1 Tax=Candidatus Syntrophonatronum acetioxidans TaxID=1795816 RepID=A0A424Y9F3_9FIRM|nr:MAG: RluA family pseudouridine synthase [Candidatus Syntrophonatronum acetioxidans]
MKDINKYLVGAEEEGKRLDVFLAEQSSSFSRSRLQGLIKEGMVRVKGEMVKSNYRVKGGDVVEVELPPLSKIEVEPQDIPLDILYEDNDVVVINKPPGMVVHPAAGHYSGTLVNALLFHCKNLSGVGGKLRPGIVHRLDKDTSGVLIAAKNDHAHNFLSRQLKERTMKREYLALVHGRIEENRGIIDAPLGRHPRDRKKMAVTEGRARKAVTHFDVLERFRGITFLKLKLETGRTHQIRVHLSYIGHPVLGDSQYGKRKQPFNLSGYALHAQTLGFIHPTQEEYMEFSAPLPEEFKEILNYLRQE